MTEYKMPIEAIAKYYNDEIRDVISEIQLKCEALGCCTTTSPEQLQECVDEIIKKTGKCQQLWRYYIHDVEKRKMDT